MEPAAFTVAGDSVLAGERAGNGTPIVLLHGLTATRRYVVHGSKVLARRGFRTIAYDARGHGKSDAAAGGEGYTYRELALDLGRVVESQAAGSPYVLAGHSMGAHTLTGSSVRASTVSSMPTTETSTPSGARRCCG